MGDLTRLKGKKVHNRDIKVSTYQAPDNCIIVEGELIDNRLVNIHHFSGKVIPPDIVHHMIIRLLINRESEIKDVEVEMLETPQESCSETLDSLNPIIGMKIQRGFTMKIKDMFTGGKGCSHLSELLVSMAPASVQGGFTAFSSKPVPKEAAAGVRAILTDTCWVWRKDGPAIKNLES